MRRVDFFFSFSLFIEIFYAAAAAPASMPPIRRALRVCPPRRSALRADAPSLFTLRCLLRRYARLRHDLMLSPPIFAPITMIRLRPS